MVVSNTETRPSRREDDEAMMQVRGSIPMGKRVPTDDLMKQMDNMIHEREAELEEEAKRIAEAEEKKREEREKEYQRRREEKRKALEAAAQEEAKKRSTAAYKLEHAIAHPVDFLKDTAKKPTQLKKMTRTESEIKDEVVIRAVPEDRYNVTHEEISPSAFVKDISQGLYQMADSSSKGVKSALDTISEFQKSLAASHAESQAKRKSAAAKQAKKVKVAPPPPPSDDSSTYEIFGPQAFFAELVELAKDLEITPRRRTLRSKSPSKRSKSRSKSPKKASKLARTRAHSRSRSKSRSSDSASYDSF